MKCGRIFYTALTCAMLFPSDTSSHSDKGPTLDFEHFEVIYPKVLDQGTRNKRGLNKFQGEHFRSNEISIEFQAYERMFRLQLRLNTELFAPHYVEIHQENGKHVRKSNIMEQQNHCHYTGTIKDYENSWTSINICSGLSGIMFDGTKTYHLHYYENPSEHVNIVVRASDMKPLNISCGNQDSEPLWSFKHNGILNRIQRYAEWQFPRRGKRARFLELFMVADNSMFRKYGSRESSVSQRISEIVNIVHAFYIELNVFVVLVGISLWNERDEITVSTDIGKTLAGFASHSKNIFSKYHADSVHLITGIDFLSTMVGFAYTGTMCKSSTAVGVNQNHHNMASFVAITLAHELGHNFNMSHDDDDNCQCPDKRCIMAAQSDRSISRWSKCSAEALNSYLSNGMDSCLVNLPTQVALPVCGDGVVEHDEQCDCGVHLPQFQACDNYCCNSTTCEALGNATCASGMCCDLERCKIREMTTPCREAQSECDLPEYCDGKSRLCPDDVFVQDGTECGNGKAFCYQGSCHSHDDQCHLLWGPDAKSSPIECYRRNTKGNHYDNCGLKDRSKESYHKCHEKDVLCGTVKCDPSSDTKLQLKYAGAVAKLMYQIRGTAGRPTFCYSAVFYFGQQTVDPGLVPNGAKCGENQACMNQKCVPAETLRRTQCPKQCSGNGICNSKGNCHCLFGYGPPTCEEPGEGGSLDSGPPADPEAGKDYILVMYMVFFCAYPLVLTTVTAFYFFCYRNPETSLTGKCQKEQLPRKKRSSFRESIKKFPRPPLRSLSQDVSYDSFSSDEEFASPVASKRVLPVIPKDPPRVQAQRSMKVPELPVTCRAPTKAVGKVSARTCAKIPTSQSAAPPVSRSASRHSLHAGIILKVPTPQLQHSESIANKSKSKKELMNQAPLPHGRNNDLEGVSKLKKLFETK